MVSRQIKYQKATQDRINLTNEVLSSMKPVKMLGLSERFQSLISQKRDDEISTAKHYRLINVYLNMISKFMSRLSTVVLYLFSCSKL